MRRSSGTYTSPGTPEYGDNYVAEMPKGWSSERVPLPTNCSRRYINSAALMPFYSGRALPSKWDDAERWITSPVSGYGASKISVAQAQRHAKSKSGPLGSPGSVDSSSYSPLVPALEGGSVRNFMANNSPFMTGVLLPDSASIQYGACFVGKSHSLNAENRMVQSTAVHQSSDMSSECSLPSSQEDKPDGVIEAENTVSRVVSRRDMATQMSPGESTDSSPERRSLVPTVPLPITSVTMQQHISSAKVEVKDVQVDKGTTVPRKFKKHVSRKTKKDLPDAQDSSPSWDLIEATKNTSKLQREEAKIAAWENLQKAKAEAAIRKLEMKLEKKRSESMDKILNKLKAAQTKAQEMRITRKEHHAQPRTSKKASFLTRYMNMGSLSSCFFCHNY